MSKLQHVLWPELDVARIVDRLSVQQRAIRAREVHNVRSNDVHSGELILTGLLQDSKLNDRVLLGARLVLDENVGNLSVSTDQKGAFAINVQRI